MRLYADPIPFVADIPPVEQIAAWQAFGGMWEFRLLAVGTVVHTFAVQDGRVVILSELTWEWEPLTLLDTVPVEHRAWRGAMPIRWGRFYRLIGKPCPGFLVDTRAADEHPPRVQHRYDGPRLPKLTGRKR